MVHRSKSFVLLPTYLLYILCFGLAMGILYWLYTNTWIAERFQNNIEVQPRILHLVLYSMDDGGPYDKMRNITQPYYSTFPNVDTYYYCYSPTITVPYVMENNILYIQGSENYIPGILKKTILAFEYFQDKLPTYDYVVRSNISTIVRFDLLGNYLFTHPVQYGCSLCFKNKVHYSSGTSITLSSKVVASLLERKNDVDYSIIDDMSIGKFIMEYMPDVTMEELCSDFPNNGFYFVPDGMDTDDIANVVKNTKIVFFRNRNQNENREEDARQMEIIVDILLNEYSIV